jgi:hypothetical protein
VSGAVGSSDCATSYVVDRVCERADKTPLHAEVATPMNLPRSAFRFAITPLI